MSLHRLVWHSNMRLSSESKDFLLVLRLVLSHVSIIRLVTFRPSVRATVIILSFDFKFTYKHLLLLQECLWVNITNRVDRNIGSFMLKTSMNINPIVNYPSTVSETLQSVVLVPLWGFGVVYFQWHCLPYVVGPSSDDKHERANECGSMLITSYRLGGWWLVGSLNPIPRTVSVSSESPSII